MESIRDISPPGDAAAAQAQNAQNAQNANVVLFEGFTPLQLKAIDGTQHGGIPAPVVPPKPGDLPKPPGPLPGVADGDLKEHPKSGGEITYDKAGNVTDWTTKDHKTTFHYSYHDTTQQRAALLGFSGQKLYQDKNGTYFQYQKDAHGNDQPVAKFVTKGLSANTFGDLRGITNPDSHIERALDAQGNADIESVDIKKSLTLRQTLDMVTDNHGHVWKRIEAGKPMHEFVMGPHHHIKDTHIKAKDSQLLPSDSDVTLKNYVLFNNAGHELDSIKPATDVQQRSLGDCYFEGPTAAVANSDPARIKQMIVDNKDGTFTVKFPLSDPTFAGSKAFDKRPTLDVTVEAPTKAEMKAFNSPYAKSDKIGFWASVMEKAHRYATGRITEDGGGFGADGLQMLTGVRRFEYLYKPGSTDSKGATPYNKGFVGGPKEFLDGVGKPDWKGDLTKAIKEGDAIVAKTTNCRRPVGACRRHTRGQTVSHFRFAHLLGRRPR